MHVEIQMRMLMMARGLALPWRGFLLPWTVLAVMANVGCTEEPGYRYVGKVGLGDERHGYNTVVDINAAGRVVGMAYQNIDLTYFSGTSAWLGSLNGDFELVGFYDSEHTGGSGEQMNTISELNESGWVLGSSVRLRGASRGRETVPYPGSSWRIDPDGNQIELGMYDERDIPVDNGFFSGWYETYSYQMAANGWVAGVTARPKGSYVFYTNAWRADPAGRHISLGYTDSAHTDPEGRNESVPVGIDEFGWATGYSGHYVDPDAPGSTAWIADPNGEMTRIGLYDALHESAEGAHMSSVSAMTASGWIVGRSRTYVDGVAAGSTAWLATLDGELTVVGLFGPEHTRDDGVTSNSVSRINEAGLAAGTAVRYSGATAVGTDAWLATRRDGTRRVGLEDVEHTGPNGERSSSISHGPTASGHVVGTSSRYPAGSSEPFYDATHWIADANGAFVVLGLHDAAHTNSDGRRSTIVDGVNDAGFAWGSSTRYDAGVRIGRTQWLFDPRTGAHSVVDLPVPPDGYSGGWITGVLQDGTAYGSYAIVEGTAGGEIDVQYRAFVWSPEDGRRDLADVLDVSLADLGIEELRTVQLVSPHGWIAASGSVLPDAADRRGSIVIERTLARTHGFVRID